MSKKSTKSQLLDEIIRSVSQKQHIVKAVPIEPIITEDILELNDTVENIIQDNISSEQNDSYEPVKIIKEPKQTTPQKDENTKAKQQIKKTKQNPIITQAQNNSNTKTQKHISLILYIQKVLLGITQGLGIYIGLIIGYVLLSIIIADLWDIPSIRGTLKPFFYWLRKVIG